MIPREGGNRFSGDFKSAYRPGTWQGSNLTARHLAAGLDAGNHTDRIIDLTVAEGGPIKKDQLWFFMSSRYFSVNNFIANTVTDAGRQGIDDQYIRSVLARLTWQISPRNKFSAYFDEVDKYRGHDMQSLEDPETAAVRWFSPAYHTNQAKWTSTISNPAGDVHRLADGADVADRGGRAVQRVVRRTHRAARSEGLEEFQSGAGHGVAGVRDVQHQQLGRDHQLRVDQRAERVVSEAEQHHAAADDRHRRANALVNRAREGAARDGALDRSIWRA